MRLNLNRNIYQKLRENSQKSDNQITRQDEIKFCQIIQGSLVGQQLLSANYDIMPFQLGLILWKNLPNEFSSVLDNLQNLIGQGNHLFDTIIKQKSHHSELENNVKSFLGALTKYLNDYDFESQSYPLLNVKLKAIVKNLEINILSFLNSFIMKLKTNEKVNYNQFSTLWINQLILHDNKNKLIDLMDIKLLKDKLVEILNLIIEENQKLKNSMSKREQYMNLFKENLNELYLVIGLANKFSQFLSFSLSTPDNLVNIYEFCFQFITVCQKFQEIEKLPYAIIFYLKLVRQRRQKAFDQVVKEQSRKVFESTFKLFENHIQKFNPFQIYNFCENFSKIQYLGFENLESIDFYDISRKTHKAITALSYSYKPSAEQQGAQYITNLFFYRKLRYIAKSIEQVVVRSYNYEEISSLQYNSKATLIDKRKQRMMNILIQFQEIRNLNQSKSSLSEDHKYELISLENIVISFFKTFPNHTQQQISNDGCFEAESSINNRFTSTIISDLILPKFDLSGFLSQKYMKNQHTITKKLFQFHLKLIQYIGDQDQRKRALNDLSRGLLLVFQEHEYNDIIIKKIVNKLSQNLIHCTYEEKITFFLDLIQKFNQNFFQIEKDYAEDSQNKKQQKRNHIKQTLQILPLIRECLKIFLDRKQFTQVTSNSNQLQTASAAMTEFWVFIVLNKSIIYEKDYLKESELENISMIALLSPNFLEGEQLSFVASKIIQLINNQSKIYVKDIKQRYKESFKSGSKQQINEMLHCLIQEEIMNNKIKLLKTHMYQISQFYKPSIYESLFFYLREVGLNAKTFHVMEPLVKQISEDYMILFRKIKLTSVNVKEEILAKDFSYLLEASCSADNNISEFSLQMIQEYIKWFPQLVYNPSVLMTFSECLTALYQKCSYEYDSKSSLLQGKHLIYSINLPTDIKKMGGTLVILMSLLQKLMLKGHFIDHNFLKVLIQHIVKQEGSISSKIDFGYRFLKYESINFRGDRNQILENILACNPFLWLINQEEFEQRIKSCNLNMFVVDRNLLELEKIKNNQPPANFRVIIENIEKSIHNEIELEFQMEDKVEEERIIKENVNLQTIVEQRMKEIANYCFNLNIIDTICSNSFKQIKFILKNPLVKVRLLPQIFEIIEKSANSSELKRDLQDTKEVIANDMKTMVASFRTVMMKKPQLKNIILSQLLDISRIYLSPTLLKYLLYRFIPFMHSLQSSYFDSTLFYTLGELLSYIVHQINNQGNLYIEERESNDDIFEVRKNIYKGLVTFEAKESFSEAYLALIQQQQNNEQYWFSQLPNIISFYQIRKKCLFKMHRMLLGFLNENMQVHIAKSLKASIIANILHLNFKIDKSMIEFVPLENICLCLKSWIELLQLQKEFCQRFGSPDQSKLQNYYYRSLKFGLYHFARNLNWYADKSGGQKINKIKDKMKLLLNVCKYFQTDKLNEIFEQPSLKIKKKSKKRYRAAKIKIDKGEMDQNFFIKISQKSTWYKKIETTIGYANSSIFSLNLYYDKDKEKEKEIRPFYLRKALINLLSDEIDKLRANSFSEFIDKYNVIKNPYSLAGKQISKDDIVGIMKELMKKSPQLVLYILRKLSFAIEKPQNYLMQLAKFVRQNYKDHLNSSHFLELFIEYMYSDKELMKENLYWRQPHIQIMLKYISKDYESFPELQLFFTKTMKKLQSEQLIFYLPQIYISLGSKAGPIIRQFLIDYSQASVLFAHQMIWMAKVESKNDEDKKKKKKIPENLKIIEQISKNLIDKIQRNMDKNQQEFWFKVNSFFEQVTSISGKLRPQQPKPEKRAIIKEQLSLIEVTQDIYMPTNPRYQIASINLDSGAPMQSAAKCPILVTFNCRKYEGPDKYFKTKVFEKKHIQKKAMIQKFRELGVNPLLFSERIVQTCENEDLDFEFKVDEDDLQAQATINNLNSPLRIKPFPKSMNTSLMSSNGNNNNGIHIADFITEFDNIKDQIEEPPVPPILKQASSNLYKDQAKKFQPQFKFTFHRDEDKLGVLREKPGEQYLQLDVEKQDGIIEDEEAVNVVSMMKQSTDQINRRPPEQVSCIFKVFDDVRQDQLALQIITLFQGIFQKANLELYVFPYKTISNRTGLNLDIGGIIEVVKNSISRDQLGKTNQCSLYDYFINKFGQEDSANFQVARENFIKSQAAYSVISYILQIKDRHNGNILINDKGHIIHIDFGFIFDISPANNLRFESANFKLTKEMIQIMGGSKDSEAFQYYVNLTIKGFLTMRNYFEHIYNTIRLMVASSLPCFLKNSMKNLVSRFVLDKNDIEAAKYMRNIIYDAYDKFTTRWYDDIQYLQNKIYR
ncbi:hypothetical protein ABPG74_007227 [Tetrahymena malaccensis]